MNNLNKPISHISNMGELKAEIRKLKISVKRREADMQERLHRLPQETVKATVGSIVPLFVNNSVAGGAIRIISTLRKLFFNRRKNKELKHEVIDDVKKIGLIAALRGIAGLLKKRKASAKKGAVTVK
jgi:hypothetical protein